MPEIQLFPTTQSLPPAIKQQILNFLRINYPEGFMGDNQFRDWTSTPDNHPAHLVMVEHGRLISHTEILWKLIEHQGMTYKVYGLSGVLTYPEFRGHGYGTQIVAAGTDLIRQSDADVGMFHCEPSLKSFYQQAGWIPMEKTVTLVGDKSSPGPADELLMMLFVSETARSQREDFEMYPLYFGANTW